MEAGRLICSIHAHFMRCSLAVPILEAYNHTIAGKPEAVRYVLQKTHREHPAKLTGRAMKRRKKQKMDINRNNYVITIYIKDTM